MARLGRDGTVEAVVVAARELFAERGPASVSIRDVARRAGVNHGLIHHYIGTREDLLRLVFARATAHAVTGLADAGDVGDAVRVIREAGGDADHYTRMLAWAVLEGRDPADFHGRSDALDAVVQLSGLDGDEERRLRVALATAMVHILGWKLFGDYAVAAAGLDGEEPGAVASDAAALIDELVEGAART